MRTTRALRARTAGAVLLALLVMAPPGAEARRRASAAKPKPTAEVQAPGTLVIFSTTTGADVEIDGRNVGKLPMEDGLAIEPGEHSLRVTLRGWTEHIDTFAVQPGQEIELEIDLIPIAGIVRVWTTEPGATVKVDGKVVGVTPFDQDVPVGRVEISVSQPGYFERAQTLDIAAGETYDLKVDLQPMPEVAVAAAEDGAFYEQWWFWTIVGVVVVGGAATAIGLTVPGDADRAPAADTTIKIPLSAW